MPVVSVVVPVYNAEQYVSRCIDTVLQQTHPEVELVLVDDGSTDSSGAICDRYAAQDQRVKVLHTTNGGPSRARNLGLAETTGEFIFFVDADDYLELDALASLVEAQARTGADMVVGDFIKDLGNETQPSGHALAFSGDTLMSERDIATYVVGSYLTKPNRYHLFVYIWGRLIRASIIRDNRLAFNEALCTYEDVAFNFDVVRHAGSLMFLNKVVLNKTVIVHDGFALATMFTETKGRTQFGYMHAFKNIKAYVTAKCGVDATDTMKHAFVVYTIIQMIRVCGQLNDQNRPVMKSLLRDIVNDPQVREALPYYRPTAGDSRMIPFLIRLKLVSFLLEFCARKNRARYRKR